MKSKVNVTKEMVELFDNYATIVHTWEGHTYKYLPFWFKKIDGEVGDYEILNFDRLPKDLKDNITRTREGEFI